MTDGRACVVPACGNTEPPLRRGLCPRHYDQWRRNPASVPEALDSLQGGCSDLPNPWHKVAPPCPWIDSHGPDVVFLWARDPEDGAGEWLCSPCARRFDAAVGGDERG